MNLCEPEHRSAVLKNIVADVQKNNLTAGDVGYRYLLRALAEGGRSDVIYAMNNQSEKPGYGYQLRMGATSLTEAWDARRSSSQNHFMLGQIMEWFYADLAGIATDPESPGFKNILIQPQPVGDVTWARASFDSVRGKIVSDWRRDGNKFTLRVVIPPNCTARVSLPSKAGSAISERGIPISQSRSAKLKQYIGDRAIVEASSGSYEFTTTY
jgi:alpha-L-rhamnosidase